MKCIDLQIYTLNEGVPYLQSWFSGKIKNDGKKNPAGNFVEEDRKEYNVRDLGDGLYVRDYYDEQ
jgi:hypothetical protein